MLEFNDVLEKAGIEPAHVLVMRHRPFEPKLRRSFEWIAADKPDLFKAYQSAQYRRAEQAMTRAKFLAAFVGREAGSAHFVSLFALGGFRKLTQEEFWEIPENTELESLGMSGWSDKDDGREGYWFDLTPVAEFEQYRGRLAVSWPGGERS